MAVERRSGSGSTSSKKGSRNSAAKKNTTRKSGSTAERAGSSTRKTTSSPSSKTRKSSGSSSATKTRKATGPASAKSAAKTTEQDNGAKPAVFEPKAKDPALEAEALRVAAGRTQPSLAPERTSAARAKTEATEPAIKAPRSTGSIWRSVAVVLLLAGVTVVIVLLATGGDDGESTVADTTPPPTAAAPPPEPAPAATPAPAPVRQTGQCAPILSETGTSYDVISSSRSGAPASCDSARPVILTALNDPNDEAVAVDGWQCAIDLAAETIASCRSGDRRIVARG